MSSFSGAVAVAVLALGFVVAMSGDYQEQQQIDANYCQMVKLYKDSAGSNGWPDYNGNYSEVCGD
jgi:hypothetical protein